MKIPIKIFYNLWLILRCSRIASATFLAKKTGTASQLEFFGNVFGRKFSNTEGFNRIISESGLHGFRISAMNLLYLMKEFDSGKISKDEIWILFKSNNEIQNWWKKTFRHQRKLAVLEGLQKRVLELMQEGPKTVADLCESLGISNGSSRSVLVRMRKKGLITRIGKGTYKSALDAKHQN